MSAHSPRVRLRQAVLVAEDLEGVALELRSALGLGEPFRDPGVAEFGIANAVFAIGDCFLEVISPEQPGTAAGRYLERHGGDGGYMAIFDIEDLEGARERAGAMGVRVVWQLDLPDISGTHLHPADIRGAIVSLDRSNPYGAWRWGGPEWTGQIADPAPGRLDGITLAVADPTEVAQRWAQVLGVEAEQGDGGQQLGLDGNGSVLFERAPNALEEGIVEIALEPAGGAPAAATMDIGGVRLRCV